MSTVTPTRAPSKIKDRGAKVNVPAQPVEIVPGIKLTDTTWQRLLDHEDSEQFIVDIVEEIYEKAMVQNYNVYLEKQAIPYTVFCIEDILMNIVKWQFLPCDEGEKNVNENYSWIEDEEPIPAIIDSWGEGMLGKLSTGKELEEDRPPTDLQTLYSEESSPTVESLETDLKMENVAAHRKLTISSLMSETQSSVDQKMQKTGVKNVGFPSKKDTFKENSSLKNVIPQHVNFIPGRMSSISEGTSSNIAFKKNDGQVAFREKMSQEASQGLKINPDLLAPQRVKTGYVLIASGNKSTKSSKPQKIMSKYLMPSTSTTGNKEIKELTFIKALSTASKTCPPDQPFPHPFTDMVTLNPGVVIKEGQNIKRPQLQNTTPGRIIAPNGPLMTLSPTGPESGVVISNIVGNKEPTIRYPNHIFLPPLELSTGNVNSESPSPLSK